MLMETGDAYRTRIEEKLKLESTSDLLKQAIRQFMLDEEPIPA